MQRQNNKKVTPKKKKSKKKLDNKVKTIDKIEDINKIIVEDKNTGEKMTLAEALNREIDKVIKAEEQKQQQQQKQPVITTTTTTTNNSSNQKQQQQGQQQKIQFPEVTATYNGKKVEDFALMLNNDAVMHKFLFYNLANHMNVIRKRDGFIQIQYISKDKNNQRIIVEHNIKPDSYVFFSVVPTQPKNVMNSIKNAMYQQSLGGSQPAPASTVPTKLSKYDMITTFYA